MKQARILFYDLETSPNIGYTWGKYEQNVIEFIRESELLSISWKWQGSAKVYTETRKSFLKGTDYALTKRLWELQNEAQILIGHNVKGFDNKKSNSRFLIHGLGPASAQVSIDTLRIARSRFAFNSNKLEDLARYLEIGGKVKTGGFQLWLDCMADKPEAYRKMARYNAKDVALLEQVYLRLRAFAPGLPNMAMLEAGEVKEAALACPVCGHVETAPRSISATNRGLKQQHQCLSEACGHFFMTRYMSDVPEAA